MSFAELSFSLRNAVRWSPPAWKRVASRAQVVETLDLAACARLEALERRFDLSAWSHCCSLTEWRESLYVLDVVHQWLPAVAAGRGLDVGAKNGCTLPGLATSHPGGWDAVELDAHRRYLWGSTRRVYGEALARHFAGCRFIAGDVRALTGPYACITWFLPFLTHRPLEAWGLPARFLEPDALLAHVVSLLGPAGVLLVVNQGPAEAALQHEAFQRLGLRAEHLGPITSPLSPFSRERLGFRFVKPAT
jgi:hypothetical protein